MTIYDLLKKYHNKKFSYNKTEEYKFFLANRDKLNKMNKFAFLYNKLDDDFSIMRANIIIYGIINKKAIEDEIISLEKLLKKGQNFNEEEFFATFKQRLLDLKYYSLEDEVRIYIPFFSKTLNHIYLNEPLKLQIHPYKSLINDFNSSIVDPFDTYGNEIFNSYFSHLIKVGTNGKEIAYYHYDTRTIYIVNSQGRLDVKIPLFDKYLKRFNEHHMLERIKPVIDNYFNNDREQFIKSLYSEGFISSKMLFLIHRKDRK